MPLNAEKRADWQIGRVTTSKISRVYSTTNPANAQSGEGLEWIERAFTYTTWILGAAVVVLLVALLAVNIPRAF